MTSISNVIAIAAGYDHTMALTADRTVWTWGGNGSAALGDRNGADYRVPWRINTNLLSSVSTIAAGQGFSLAVSNGYVYAWGNNAEHSSNPTPSGQLGTNTITSTNSPMLVAGISNVVLVSATSSDRPEDESVDLHVVAMTVDPIGGTGQTTNHFWGWGSNVSGPVGNGTRGDTNYVYSPAQIQFCTRCQRCVQLGTGGVFTAQCNGTLYLYFNGDMLTAENALAYPGSSYSGSYTAAVNNVTNEVPAYSDAGIEFNGPGYGVSFGTVTNGGTYTYSAWGYCTYDDRGYLADANGVDFATQQQASCVPTSHNFHFNQTNSVCPMWKCFSLVGKIQ